MSSWVVLLLCVAFVAGQVVVPRLSPENQRATEEHLAAVAKATQAHFAAHKDLPKESGPSYGPQQGYAAQPNALPYAPQQNAFPYAPQGQHGYSSPYNPFGFGYNYPH